MKNIRFNKLIRFGLVIVFAICYVLYVVYSDVNELSPFRGLPLATGSGYAIGTSNLTLFTELEPPNDFRNLRTSMKITGIFYETAKEDETNLDKMCFEKVFLKEVSPRGSLSIEDLLTTPGEPACYSLIADDGRGSLEGRTVLYTLSRINTGIRDNYLFHEVPQIFRYPYDNFETYLSMQITYYVMSGEKKFSSQVTSPVIFITFPEIRENLNLNNFWNVSIFSRESEEYEITNVMTVGGATSEIFMSKDNFITFRELNISFLRPIIYRIAYPIVLIALVFLLAILATVDSVDTFLEISIAALFSIYGLRQILVPSNIEVPTILDSFVLGLYLIFSLILVMFVVRMMLKKEKSKEIVLFTSNSTRVKERLSSETPHNQQKLKNATVLGLIITLLGIGATFSWISSKVRRRN